MALAVNVPHDFLMQFRQRLIAGAAHDAAMEVIIEVVIEVGRIFLGRLLHLAINLFNLAQNSRLLRLRDADRRELLQTDQDFHGLANLGGVRIGHHRADMGNELDKTF